MEVNKIYNGDSLKVMRDFPDKSFDVCITDPPYGIDFQSARRTDKSQWKPKIANDEKPFIEFLPEVFRVLKDDAAVLCFTRFDVEEEFRVAMRAAGFTDKAQIIWDKVIHGMGDLTGDFASQHENIIFATKGNWKFPGQRPKSIFRINRVDAEKLIHPNEKPVSLMRALIEAITKPGDLVLEPFSGSGATCMAAKEIKRNFVGIELEERYAKIGQERIEKVTVSMF